MEVQYDGTTRRTLLHRGGALALLGASGAVTNLVAACGGSSTRTNSPKGSGPGDQTTWERVKSTKTVNIGVANEYPAAFIQGTKLQGFSPDVIRATLGPYGVTNFASTVTEFDSLIPGLTAKRFDMIGGGMFIEPARCAQVNFGEPEAYQPDYALVAKGNPKGVHVANDLAKYGVTVAVETGSFEEMFVKEIGVPASKVFLVPSDIDEFSAVPSGRADVALFNKPALEKFVSQHPTEVEIATPWTPPVNPTNGRPFVAWPAEAFRKEDLDFLSAWNKSLVKVRASGELARIATKWQFDPVDATTPTTVAICAGKYGT